MLLSLLLSAHAATCDVKALQAAFTAASPSSSGKVYADLAACDPAAAKAFAPTAFQKILSGDGGNAALLAAISVGAGDVVRPWLTSREPDERSSAILMLGSSCDKPGVPGFFTSTAASIGDKFWIEGWYSGLATCRDKGVQELLRGAITNRGTDRTRFYGILNVFSKNLGKDAIPFLKALLEKETDTEVAANIVSSFADAVQADPAAKAAAVEAILSLAPKLSNQAVNQARITLTTMGAEAEADTLAAARYRDQAQNGKLSYAVVVVDAVTCKNGDKKAELHVAQVTDSGKTWPDQLLERLKPASAGFKMDLASRCKGTGTPIYLVPDAPFKDKAALDAWVNAQIEAQVKAYDGAKLKRIDEEPITL